MKKLIFAVAAVLFTISSTAQNEDFKQDINPEMRAERTVMRLSKQMDLTEEEKEQLMAVHLAYFEKEAELRQEKNENMQDVLGEERYKQLRAKQKERRETFREKRREKRGKMKQHHHKHQDADQPRKK